ncbi:MAG: AAA family ATPase, partial [Planctomycetota bacterium]
SFPVVGMAKATLHQEIEQLAADYDDVVIDGPPRAAEVAKSIIMSADIVIVPIQPSPLDVWEAAKTVDLIREAQTFKPSLRCCLVINRRIANTAIGRDVREALGELQVPIIKGDIGQRILFAESAASGETVIDQPKSKAAKEIKRFVKELRRIK